MGLRDDKEILFSALDAIVNGVKRNARSRVMDGMVEFLDGRPASVKDFRRWAEIANAALSEVDHAVQNRLGRMRHCKPETLETVLGFIQAESLPAYEIANRSGFSVHKVRDALTSLRHMRRVYIDDYVKRGTATTAAFRAGSLPDKPRPKPTTHLPVQDRASTKLIGEKLLHLMPDDRAIDRHQLAALVGNTPIYIGVVLEALVDDGLVEMVGLKRTTKLYKKKP